MRSRRIYALLFLHKANRCEDLSTSASPTLKMTHLGGAVGGWGIYNPSVCPLGSHLPLHKGGFGVRIAAPVFALARNDSRTTIELLSFRGCVSSRGNPFLRVLRIATRLWRSQ